MSSILQVAAANNLTGRRLKERDFHRIEQVNTIWTAHIEDGVPYDDILKPEFWANIAATKKINEFDWIKIRPARDEYVAILIVVQAGDRWLRLEELLPRKELGPRISSKEGILPGHKVEHRGPSGWCIIREIDNEPIAKKLGTEANAYAELAKLAPVLTPLSAA